MEFKNAGLKSKEEAMHQMVDGKRFKYGEWWIYYDEEEQGFRCHGEFDGKQQVRGLWTSYKNWQVKVDWKEILSPDNPRWFRVPHTIGLERRTFSFHKIIGCFKEDDLFTTETGLAYYGCKPASEELAAILDAEVG
jgi:hypothetical protein